MANLTHLTDDQRVRLAVVTIREAIKKGPDESGVSDADRAMVALADCQRCWLTSFSMSLPSRQLWADLNVIQRAAVIQYLNGPQ